MSLVLFFNSKLAEIAISKILKYLIKTKIKAINQKILAIFHKPLNLFNGDHKFKLGSLTGSAIFFN